MDTLTTQELLKQLDKTNVSDKLFEEIARRLNDSERKQREIESRLSTVLHSVQCVINANK